MESLHNEILLIEAMQAGSEEAFTTLYRHYSPRLYINMLGMVHDSATAEEMVQELFTRIWHKRENKGISENFTGYMFRIAQHLVYDFFRKLKRDRKLQEKFRLLAGEQYDLVEFELHDQQSVVILQRAVEQLSVQQKKVYELVRLEGYTYKKAAEAMDISPLTVKEYLATAHKSIRKFMLNHPDVTLGLLLYVAARTGAS